MFIRKAILVGLIAALGWFMASPTQAAESTLQTILTRGEIIVGMDIPYEPFELKDDDGNIVGFEPDVLTLMADQLGVKLMIKTAGSFDTIRAELNSGDFDIVMSGMTRTLPRAREVNFTDGYYAAGQIAMISKTRELGGKVTKYADLNVPEAVISAQSGTTGEGAANEFFPNAQVNPFPTTPLSVQEVIDGRADAVIMDDASIIATYRVRQRLALLPHRQPAGFARRGALEDQSAHIRVLRHGRPFRRSRSAHLAQPVHRADQDDDRRYRGTRQAVRPSRQRPGSADPWRAEGEVGVVG